MTTQVTILSSLRTVINTPSLAVARDLESALRAGGYSSRLFGRLNQKSSIDAAAESDRGIVERIANSFDASLTAARRLTGVDRSDSALTPRIAAQRFLNANTDGCIWEPQRPDISFEKPAVQFWSDTSAGGLRFRSTCR